MEKILITGLNGFIGKNLLAYVKNHYASDFHNIVALSSVPIEGVTTIIYESHENFGNITIPHEVSKVIHMGAWTPKSTEEANDVEKSISNISFVKNLLHSLEGHRIEQFFFFSSLHVYPQTKNVISESSEVKPISLYGDSKLFCERVVERWCYQHNSLSQILRVGHIYGRGEEKYKKIIPLFIKKIIAGNPIEIYSSGNEKRSFLHVDDCVKFIWKSKDFSRNNIINVVSGIAVTVFEIAKILVDISGKKIDINVQNQNIETRDMVFDNTLMQSLLPFKEMSLVQGLKDEYNYLMNL